MCWRRRVLLSASMLGVALWLTTAAASAQSLPSAPSAASKTVSAATKAVSSTSQAVQSAAPQPAKQAADTTTKTAATAAKPLQQSVQQTVKSAPTAIATVVTRVEKAVLPPPTPPALPPLPVPTAEAPRPAQVVTTLTEVAKPVLAEVVAPPAQVVGAVKEAAPVAEPEPDPIAAEPEPAPAPMPPAARAPQPAARVAVAKPVAPAPEPDPTPPSIVDEPPAPPPPARDNWSDARTPAPSTPAAVLDPARLIELNAPGAFPPIASAPEPAAIAEAAPVAPTLAPDLLATATRVSLDVHSALGAQTPSAPVSPAAPLEPTTSVPTTTLSFSSSAVTTWLAPSTPAWPPDTWRSIQVHAQRLPSVAVLPNLAPPG